jgi:hypothetical protein
VVQWARQNAASLDSGTEARLHVILARSALFFAGAADTSGTHGVYCWPESFGVVEKPNYGVVFTLN